MRAGARTPPHEGPPGDGPHRITFSSTSRPDLYEDESSLLRPYVPRLVATWLAQRPDELHRRIAGTLVFADISGFTALTERLARRGKVGAEEMGDVLNGVFGELLTDAYRYGAALLKWGGDAVLLLFDGDDGADHAARACRAAWDMQQTIRRVGQVRTTAGRATLRMSVGIDSGTIDAFLVGRRHRELVVVGPVASGTATMEQLADAGEILLAPATAAAVDPAHLAATDLQRSLLAAPPDAPAIGPDLVEPPPVPLEAALPRVISSWLLANRVEFEHRPVVTGFVQFGGTDELLEHGPERAAQALGDLVDVCEDVSDRHGVTFLATDIARDGGKVIITAGVPLARGDGAERVIGALRDIVDHSSPLALRAGAAAGRVFVGDFGPPFRRTYSIVGDSVNLAARLMSKAEPGQVVASVSLVEQSRAGFPTKPITPFAVKGKAELQHAVLVTGAPRDRPVRAATQPPLVGRACELADLQQRGTEAGRGRGGAVEVVADPGMGRTRLIDEFASQVGGSVHRAWCSVYDNTTPYTATRALLRSIAGLSAEATSEETDARLRQLVADHCPDQAPWLPFVSLAAGGALPPTPEVRALDDAFVPARLAQAVVAFLAAVVTGPLVLVVEDGHLMDRASAHVLAAAAAAAPSSAWLLVTTRLTASGARGVTVLSLEPLDATASEELVDHFIGDGVIGPHDRRALIQRGEGNPLYLRELVAGCLAASLVELPDSIESLVSAQIDRLAPGARSVLRCAAVLGNTVDRQLLHETRAALHDESLDPGAPHVVDELDDFLVETEGGWRFRTSLVRDTAYESLPFRRRRQVHAAAGQAITRLHGTGDDQVGALSLHAFVAQDYPAALTYARRAAEAAQAGAAHVEAMGLYNRAVQAERRIRPRDPARAASVAFAWGQSCLRVGAVSDAESAFRIAHQHAVDRDTRMRAKLLLAESCTRTARHRQALRWLTRGIHELGVGDAPSGDPEVDALAGELCMQYANVRLQLGQPAETMSWAARAISLAEHAGSRRGVAGGYQLRAMARLAGGDFESDADGLAALAIWQELDNTLGQAMTLNNLGARSYYLGGWNEALRFYEQARALHERGGNLLDGAMCSENMAEILADQGHLSEAEAMTRQALRVFVGSATPSFVAAANAQLGLIAMRAGRHDEARGLLESARRQFEQAGEPGGVVQVDCRRAELLLCTGSPAEAVALVEATLPSAGPGTAGLPYLPALHRIQGLALADTDGAAAAAALERSLYVARALGAEHDIALSLDALLGTAPAAPDPERVAERDALWDKLGLARARSVAFVDEAYLYRRYQRDPT